MGIKDYQTAQDGLIQSPNMPPKSSTKVICVPVKEYVDQKKVIEDLEKKILMVKQGVIPMPDFKDINETVNEDPLLEGLHEIKTLADAFYYGWASCELEYGELLSKPIKALEAARKAGK